MDKKELRKYIRSLKSQYSAEDLSGMSQRICDTLKMDGLWRSAGTVLLYYALKDEVDVRRLIDNAVFAGKKVLLPVVTGDDLELRVYEGTESMREGAYGILEPTGPVFPVQDYPEINLVLVPGMAFDDYGNRLGRGKGYYDRLLPRLIYAYRIGVCFPFQKQEKIPCEEFDVRMNEVVC